jgi:hypothetical protein
MPSIEQLEHTVPVMFEALSLLREIACDIRAIREHLEAREAPASVVPPEPSRQEQDRRTRARYNQVVEGQECPRCHAEMGANCRTPQGAEVWPPHVDRLRRAGMRL